jgi:DNA polymerase-4
MRALFKQTLPYSPRVEPGDRDGHLFVDVTGTSRLFGPAIDVAWRLRKQIQAHLNFVPIWSVAPNKLVAKVATRLVKPVGEYIVGAGEEEKFLAPLPVQLLPGIERGDLSKLREFNLAYVYQVAALSPEQLSIPFENQASLLYEVVRGIDSSPVLQADEKQPKVILDHEFEEDTNDAPTINRTLYGLIEKAGKKLRNRRLAARRLCMVLDYSDGVRHFRQASAKPPTANDITLFELAHEVLTRTWIRRIRIRHLRLIFDKLIFPPAQLELFPTDRRKMERRTHLVGVMDDIRSRFGPGAIQMGRMVAA